MLQILRNASGETIWWPRQESNLGLELRKLLYYPLYDEAIYYPGAAKIAERVYCNSFLAIFCSFVAKKDRVPI